MLSYLWNYYGLWLMKKQSNKHNTSTRQHMAELVVKYQQQITFRFLSFIYQTYTLNIKIDIFLQINCY